MSADAGQKSNIWLWLALVLGAAALAVLLTLGTWQVQRLAWKEGLIATIEQRTKQAPAPLSDIVAKLNAGEPVEYLPVTATGTFDHDKEQHFFATFDGLSGYYLYTPLMMDDGKVIFVNRGFVPFDKKDPQTRPESLTQGPQTISGLARSAPKSKAGWVVPDNDPAKNIFYWKDITAMTGRAGLNTDEVLPMFIDQNDNANTGKLPIGGVTIINLPNNHLQYAITWYGLALTLIGVLGYYFFRHRKNLE